MIETCTNAEAMLSSFLSQHATEFKDFTNVPIEETGLLEDFKKYPLTLTHFNDIYDTLIYSNLIAKALLLNPGIKKVYDFGAGSSVPTLLALKKTNAKNVQAIAYDIDPEAESVGKKNAEVLGLTDYFQFRAELMQHGLGSSEIFEEGTLIVSNPPYIASPQECREHHFVPINGGEDGSDLLEKILLQNYSSGTTLALLWGSLTNPRKILPIIESYYEVVFVEAVKIHFGHYTSHPLIKNHLYQLKHEGRISFEVVEKIGEVQTVLGTILKRK
jgi:SAM-dependent methyltransferase